MPQEQQSVRVRLHDVRWASGITGGIAVCSGLIAIAGWGLHLPRLVELRPGWGGMVLATAVCFILAGSGLLVSHLDSHFACRAQLWLASTILLIATLTIVEVLTGRNLGFDFPVFHASMLPDYASPGRMAPNTALGFLLIGLALGICGLGRKGAMVRTLAGAIFLIGGSGFAGYCLGMKFLYGWYTSSGLIMMALPTSLNMVVLAFGLWHLSAGEQESDREDEPEPRVLRMILGDTMALLLLTAVAVAITGISFMQTTVFRYTSDQLSQLASDDHQLIELTIDHRSERAAVAGGGTWLSQLMRVWDSDPKAGSARGHAREASAAAMRSFAATLLGQGFSGIIYRGLNGRTLRVGTMIDSPPIRVSIHRMLGEELIWNQGFYLTTIVEMRDKDGTAGEMLTQQPLPALDGLERSMNASSRTGALVLCGRPTEQAVASCFPTRSEPLPFRINLAARALPGGVPPQTARKRVFQPLPVALAFAGQTGVILSRDYRGQPITAAYSPLENGSLGLVLKIDTAETYAPIRRSLTVAIPLAILIVSISLWLMQRRLTPLVDGLVDSREKIQQLALHDPLTGLPNRSLMDDRLRMALEWARRNHHSVALAVVDLDDFKMVNDTLGHEAGDLLLCAVARRMEGCLRASDTVARLGGDEFVLILNEIQSASAVNVMAQKILAAFSYPIDLSGQTRSIHLSMGFALSPPGGGDEDSLIRHADAAMYSAKRSGGSRVIIFEEPEISAPTEVDSTGAVLSLQQITSI